MITLQIIIIETVIASARSGLQPPEWRGSTSTKCKAGKVSSSRCRIPRRPILASVRPNVRQGLFHRTPGRSDGPTHERQLGQYTEEKPLASDARTVRTLVEHGGRRRRRATEKPSLVPFSSPPLYHCQKRPYRICSGFWLCSGKMLRTLANPGAALPWGIAWLHLSSVFVDLFGPPWPPRH